MLLYKIFRSDNSKLQRNTGLEAEASGVEGQRTCSPDYELKIKMMMMILTLLGYVDSNPHPSFLIINFQFRYWKLTFL